MSKMVVEDALYHSGFASPVRHSQKLRREGQETNAVDEPRITIQQPANLLYCMRLRMQK